VDIVDPELVMQVGASGPAGASDVADGFALGYARTRLQAAREAAQVTVASRVLVAMAQDDEIPVPVLLADEFDRAVRCGLDGRAVRCCLIDTLVFAPSAEHWVKPHREA